MIDLAQRLWSVPLIGPAAQRAWRVAGGVSVRNKILGIVLALVVVLGGGITLQVRRAFNATLQGELHARGVSVARDVAARSVDLLLVHDLYGAHELLRDTVGNNRDVAYAFLLDEDGQVLVHTFDDGFPMALLPANESAATDRYHLQRLGTSDGVVWDFAVPVLDGRAGTARVGLSEATLNEAMVALTGQMVLTTVAVSLVGVLAAMLLTWLITRPILDLVSVTRAVAQGDLSVKATVWADDEFGQLTRAFNAMMDDLLAARGELESFNARLLRRNEELARLNAVVLEKEAARSQLLEKIIAAQEEERRRIARELHDDTSQSLTSLKLGLRVLERPQPREALLEQLATMRETVGQTLEALHDLALDLRPSVLDDLGLVAALERYSRECQRRYHLPVTVQALGFEGRRLPMAVETALYRIAQEALTNVARHAGAGRAEMVLDYRGAEVRMVVEDDGAGFDPRLAGDGRRLGLYGMRERAELVGGEVSVDSAPGRGTTVIVRVPVAELSDDEVVVPSPSGQSAGSP